MSSDIDRKSYNLGVYETQRNIAAYLVNNVQTDKNSIEELIKHLEDAIKNYEMIANFEKGKK